MLSGLCLLFSYGNVFCVLRADLALLCHDADDPDVDTYSMVRELSVTLLTIWTITINTQDVRCLSIILERDCLQLYLLPQYMSVNVW